MDSLDKQHLSQPLGNKIKHGQEFYIYITYTDKHLMRSILTEQARFDIY